MLDLTTYMAKKIAVKKSISKKAFQKKAFSKKVFQKRYFQERGISIQVLRRLQTEKNLSGSSRSR
jgi:hypothetical protein